MKTRKLGYHDNRCPNHWVYKSWNQHIVSRMVWMEDQITGLNSDIEEDSKETGLNKNFLLIDINELMRGVLQGTKIEEIYHHNHCCNPESFSGFSRIKKTYREICILLEIESCFNVLVDFLNEDESSNNPLTVFELDLEHFLKFIVSSDFEPEMLEIYFEGTGHENVPSRYELFHDIVKLAEELKDL